MKKTASYFLLLASLAVVFKACKKDDPPLPPISVAFQAAEVGLDATQDEASITVTLSRATNIITTVKISLEATGVVYGTDFSTIPGATGNEISLEFPAGTTSAAIKVTKDDDLLLSGGEEVKFTITSLSDATGLIGTNNVSILKFDAIVSEGTSSFIMSGKTEGTSPSNYGNVVYVDLSNSTTFAADRKSWNLGFKSGADFRVILNHAYQGVAFTSGKTDITTVTEADAASVDLGFAAGGGSLSYIDDISGDLTKTAIAEIKAGDGDNPVYFVASEANRTTKAEWYKVKITRDGTTGYKVQYAKLGETSIKTVTIAKKADYNFTFFSLENNKEVSVEPKASGWDIVWSYGTYITNFGTGMIPYWFQDLVMINSVAGVQAAEITLKEADGTTAATEATTVTKFNAFAAAHVDTVTNFSGARNAIADKWRVTTGAGIRRDRFYLVKDGSGNVYKLRFVKMGVGDTGERGKPEIDFKLVKKG